MNLIEIRQRISMGESIYDLPLRVTFYARVSTEKDAQINSLNNQISYYTDFINSIPKWVYVDGYIDEGISGTSVDKRENFLKMIEDSSENKFDLILTKEISRFSRNTLDSIKYTQELLYNNVGVLFQSDNINTIMPDSELRLTIMSSIAQEEVRKLSDRVKFGFKRSMEKGRVLGNSVIIGYDKKDGKMTINEKEAEVIRIVFEMYSTGKYGLKAISTYLFEHGYKNKKGGYYANSTVKGIIRNPKYKGYYCANKFKHIDYKSKKQIRVKEEDWILRKDEFGNVPAIVSEEIWNKANEVLDKKSCGFCKKIKDSSVFRVTTTYGGKLYCAEHNKPFRRHTDHRSKRHVWICDVLHRNGVNACPSAILYEEELDIIFKKIINKIIEDRKDIIEHLYELYLESFESVNYKNEIDRIEKKIDDIILKKNRILDLLINETISKEDYQRRIKELDQDIERNNVEIEKLLHDEQVEIKIKKKYKNLKKEIENELNSEESYPELFRLFVDKVIVHKINGDRHNVNLEIYINVLNEKLIINNKKFINEEFHPLCSHKEDNYFSSIFRRRYN